MSGKISRHPLPATCEDYNDDTNTTIHGTRRSANVAAKRSKPELPKVKASEPVDGASDSGYSSRTAATVGSGDSTSSGKRSPPNLRVDTSNKDTRAQRPPLTERPTDSAHRSANRPDPQRSPSKNKKRESLARSEQLAYEQQLHQQQQQQQQRGRPAMAPVESPWMSEYPAYSYTLTPVYTAAHIPPTPQSAKHPPPQVWAQEIYIPQASNTRPRLNSSQSYQRPARPMTFHQGMQDVLWMPQTPTYDHGPPPSASAYVNAPYTMAPYPPTSMAYAPAPVPAPIRGRSETQPPPSPYHDPRPRQRTEQTSTNRRASLYGPPVVDYVQSPRDGPKLERRRSSSHHHRPAPPAQAVERDEDYYRMPPPQVIPLKSRPSVRKAAAPTPTTAIRRPSKESFESRPEAVERVRREDRESEPVRQRPSIDRTEGKKPASFSNGSGMVRAMATSGLHRSKTYHGQRDLEQKAKEIEDYQTSKSGKPLPLTADSLKHVRRSHKVGSDSGSQTHSRTSSSRSQRSSSDVKTKSGTTSRGDQGLSMTVNGVKLDFGDQLEGKTISLTQTGGEDGTYDIKIAGKAGKTYLVSKDEIYRRREIDDDRRARDESRGDRTSRRTSRSGTSDRGSVK